MSAFITPTPIRSPSVNIPVNISSRTPSMTITTAPPTASPASVPFALPPDFPQPDPLSTLVHSMSYAPLSPFRRFLVSLRLFFLIRNRLSSRTVLLIKLEGAIPESSPRPMPFSAPPPISLPELLKGLKVAAYDPRVAHVHVRLGPIACGWGKLFEIRRHFEMFRQSGKGLTFFMEGGGMKEFFLAMGFALYVPPEGALGLRGFVGSGSFVGGVLEKAGVTPQVERIGKYKSAGDQLGRKDMSEAQREVLQGLIGETWDMWRKSVVEATGVSMEDLEKFVDRSPWDMTEYVKMGLITGLAYEGEVLEQLKKRFKSRWQKEEDVKGEINALDIRKYVKKVSEGLVGLGGGRKTVAVIKVVGAITSGKSGRNPVMGATVGSESLVELIRKVREEKKYVACLLRCDSPGGSALASDIVWNELKKLGKEKPLLASMSDVAASGGYYLSMASEIIAEPMTITGSIGVVAAKPSLGGLYGKLGYAKENISAGSKFAELLVDDRGFTEEESEYFREGVELAYRRFVSKAAESRGKSYEEMHEVAQGRVWTGAMGLEKGIVDYLGGMERALEILKEKSGMKKEDKVRVEVLKNRMTFAERLGLGAMASGTQADWGGLKTLLREPLALSEVDGTGHMGVLATTILGAVAASMGAEGGIGVGNVVREVVKAVMDE